MKKVGLWLAVLVSIVAILLAFSPRTIRPFASNRELTAVAQHEFPYKHWLMQHIYQRYEAKKLLTRKREDQKEAWRLHYEIGIANHNKLEDDLLFPSFTTEDSKRAVVQMTADHEKLLPLAKTISAKLESGEDVAAEFATWSAAYIEHTLAEERLLVPCGKDVTPEKRTEVGKNIKEMMKELSGGKLALCLFREVGMSGDAVATDLYSTSFPFFVRRVLTPIFSLCDADYSAHCKLFGSIDRQSGCFGFC